jgi:serine/threonine-protein kinase
VQDPKATTERVGRYQLLEPIGGGPNGMVARAKVFGVAGFERQFAVKRFAPELTVGPIAQALSQAARSYGSLEHPRIARMSEFGVAQGQTFTAVEYVAGLDAFRLLQEAKLAGVAIAAGGALALVSQAARAVGYAHGRGLSHLGLCPTNVIVTVDGDVKVTDFGILAATMPQRPIESARLAHRIPYLAPEQIAGEATSAATDVFVLGVIAYELVTGQRAYRGDTPGQIAQAIVSGPPAEPPLPRPIVRVLQRCLARSPFERFPDARALADALDAALRVAPVPGTRKDIGAQIKTTLDRYASLNEGNLSGMVALNLQAQTPIDPHDISTQPYARLDNAKTDVSPVVPSAAATIPEMPKHPFATVPGLAPPPIPVPPGVTPPPGATPAPPANPARTMLGVKPVGKPSVPGVIPPIAKPNGPPRTPATRATPPPMPAVKPPGDEILEPSGLIEMEPSGIIEIGDVANTRTRPESGQMPAHDPATMQGVGPGNVAPAARPSRPTPGQNFESQTGEMSTSMLDELNRRSVKNTSEIESLPKPPELEPTPGEPPSVDDQVAAFAREMQAAADDAPDVSTASAEPARAPTVPSGPIPSSAPPTATILGHAPPLSSPIASPTASSAPMAPVAAPSPSAAPTSPAMGQTTLPVARKSKAPVAALVVLLAGGIGAAGYFAYATMSKKQPETPQKGSAVVAKTPGDAGAVAVAKPDAAKVAAKPEAKSDAGVAVATATPDAAAKSAPADAAVAVATATPDAGTGKPVTAKPTATSDKLQITSKPSGARVFIDGADQGTTPVKLDGSADRHTMVLLAPGHDLYIGEVDGHGVFDIQLKPITPTGGNAGIKVLKCKAKERYYVYVDGAPTGMTCPTERIDTVVGQHTVEVYDIVTDSRRKFDVFVKDERLSARVRIDD